MTALLEVAGLVSGYGSGTVLGGVDLTVGAGEVVAVVGRNGAGKTTLLQTILGIVDRRAGDRPVRRRGPHRRLDDRRRPGRRSATSPRAGGSSPPSTSTSTCASPAARDRGHRPPSTSSSPAWPSAATTAAGSSPAASSRCWPSAGRWSATRACCCSTNRPTAWPRNLVAEVMALLDRLRAAGMSVLLVEQDLAAALSVADRVAVLDQGTVSFEAPVPGLDRSVLEDLLLPGRPTIRP